MHPLWFYKHQHDNRVRSKLFVACQRWWFHGGSDSYVQFRDTHAPCLLKLCISTSNGIVRWWLFPEFGAEFLLDNCTPTIILNNPVFNCATFCTSLQPVMYRWLGCSGCCDFALYLLSFHLNLRFKNCTGLKFHNFIISLYLLLYLFL